MSWGQELIVDAYDANIENISSYLTIEKFAIELVRRIDMIPYGEPKIVYFGTGDKRGYTLVQLIETSNISAHFSEDTGNFYLNVFSCKEFSSCAVLDVVKEYFDPKRIVTRTINRGE
jgi:S-adenosylmethionine/arginine decarboxylase-like enzyme